LSSDALGRRSREWHLTPDLQQSVRNLYYTTNWQLIEERGVVLSYEVSQYVWSAAYIDGLALRYRDYNGDTFFEEQLYVIADANWNVTAIADATSGSIVEHYTQDPYGQFQVYDASWQQLTNSAYRWDIFHQGARYDYRTHFFHFRGRDYSPTLMRWISQDPIGFAGGTSNLYQYEGDGPVNGLDPWGLQENYLPQILLDKIREDNRATTRRIEELLKVLAREQEEQRVDTNEKAAFLANGGSCQSNMSNFDLTGGAGLTPEPPWAEQLKTDPNAPPYKYSPIVTRVINGAITHEPENTQHLVPSELDSFTYASMAIPWATTGRFFGLGVNESSKTPVPRASVAGPKGDVYSVAFQTELKCSSYPGLSRASHFQEANENLLRMMETSRDFTQKWKD
jgi:RHS repeat-associated protein